MSGIGLSKTVEVLKSHVLSQLDLRRERPLFVALQGPQGSGKSWVSGELQKELGKGTDALRVVVLSIDDLYLPHSGLVSFANSHTHNRLLQGRGQPGTHDIGLGIEILSGLKVGRDKVRLPRFDKSRFNGEGDRVPVEDSPVVEQPPRVDVVIVEGWCVGFRSLSDQELSARWETWEQERTKLEIPEELCTLRDIQEINESLKQYDALWDFFDVFVQAGLGLPPSAAEGRSRYSIIYQWRLEQEHYMKAKNGGIGMSDQAVKAFVDVTYLGMSSLRRWKQLERREEHAQPYLNP
ncbi:D-glycerate 3-kinase [Coprinopsis cinerea okayama7|uniref:D-glycerate 3-kinase n=1 Tax=Coprinopsis cinerea (strain Okayama-7 / 130 / ATCC MYA-4618 / FGSC 9003) TaxID=240176 RepID=A8N5R8_COPC7|nr:D-glycerate 3-kinase [Coprinopsis cinerea okayama7\|eukprot:XP_001830213.2 D-glycerate 3-kinase [Coprinopsis cinerea okayama7\